MAKKEVIEQKEGEVKVSSQMRTILDSIEKRFGKEAIAGKQDKIEFLSSGSIGLDLALGGGWAKGRVVELFGWESSGKSTLALHAAAECQKQGKIVVYIDTEHALDEAYANALGVDTSRENGLWYLCQPGSGEEAFEIAREFAKSDEVGLIVNDSVSAMIPRAVLAGEAGESKMGIHAKLMSSMLPTLIAPAMKSGAIIMMIGQLREKIGIMFGNPETTMGGNALKFYASQRIQVSKAGQTKSKDGEEVIASGCKCKVMKNKVAPPFKIAQFNIAYGIGIDKIREIVDFAVEFEIINKKGAGFYSYGENKLCQGEEKLLSLLNDNPELLEEITEKVKQELKN